MIGQRKRRLEVAWWYLCQLSNSHHAHGLLGHRAQSKPRQLDGLSLAQVHAAHKFLSAQEARAQSYALTHDALLPSPLFQYLPVMTRKYTHPLPLIKHPQSMTQAPSVVKSGYWRLPQQYQPISWR